MDIECDGTPRLLYLFTLSIVRLDEIFSLRPIEWGGEDMPDMLVRLSMRCLILKAC